jgi:TRAP-type C4-dicarboxylate transport system permease small subunit
MDNGRNGRPNRFLRIVSFVEDAILIVLLTAMIGLAVAQILLRNFFESGIAWADPLLRALVLWIGLTGALVATRLDNHISINVLNRYLTPRAKLLARVFVDFFTAAVCGVVAYHATRLVVLEYGSGTIAFEPVPAWLVELVIPVAFGVMAVRYLAQGVQRGYEVLRNLPRP